MNVKISWAEIDTHWRTSQDLYSHIPRTECDRTNFNFWKGLWRLSPPSIDRRLGVDARWNANDVARTKVPKIARFQAKEVWNILNAILIISSIDFCDGKRCFKNPWGFLASQLSKSHISGLWSLIELMAFSTFSQCSHYRFYRQATVQASKQSWTQSNHKYEFIRCQLQKTLCIAWHRSQIFPKFICLRSLMSCLFLMFMWSARFWLKGGLSCENTKKCWHPLAASPLFLRGCINSLFHRHFSKPKIFNSTSESLILVLHFRSFHFSRHRTSIHKPIISHTPSLISKCSFGHLPCPASKSCSNLTRFCRLSQVTTYDIHILLEEFVPKNVLHLFIPTQSRLAKIQLQIEVCLEDDAPSRATINQLHIIAITRTSSIHSHKRSYLIPHHRSLARETL